MNSTQRLLATLRCGVPDRVPISTYELCGYNSRSPENLEPSYGSLMEAIRAGTDCICMWNPGSNGTFLCSSHPVPVEAESHREGDGSVTKRVLRTPGGTLRNTIKVVDGIRTVWQTEHWCKTSEDVDCALSVPYEPIEYEASDFARIQGEVGSRGIIMASLADALCVAADLMAFGDYTVWAMMETEHFSRTMEAIHERVMENLRRMLDVNVCHLYRICGPEYATPPYLPPTFFERFVVPYVTEMVELIHNRGALARFHCHGRIGRVLDMILETGADAIDPCEGPPDGDISLADVKAKLAGKMCVCGNIQLKVLEHGTSKEVRETVRECMAAAKEGGGYIIMPTAAPIDRVLRKKTEENYLCFIETALEDGEY